MRNYNKFYNKIYIQSKLTPKFKEVKLKLNYTDNMDYYEYRDVEVRSAKREVLDLFISLQLDNMPQLEQEVYFYKNKLGYSHKRIAEILGIGKRQSRLALYRAKKKLKKLANDIIKFKKSGG